ncbi:reverse transcriptase domain-containing protein [Tanacetum coccineum]
MCFDFTDINKACPKDCYPLPEIDWKMESLSGFRLKCFLDAYKGYHQIQMAEGLVDNVFNDQIGRNLEAYVDDMLNPKKCSFGVEEGPFLGHLITKHEIKANPPKVKAITDHKPPKILKEIQSLNGKLVALSPSTESISSILLAEREKKQVMIYFISMVLQRAELNYLELKKIIIALVHAARRLKRYFQAHPIRVLTDKPIKQILARPNKLGRKSKCAIELGEHNIEFKGRNSVKGKILADFLAKTPSKEENDTNTKKSAITSKVPTLENVWKLYTDGASSSDRSSAGLMIGLVYLESNISIMKA